MQDSADRMERAVNSCRKSAIATGGAAWVAAVDELVAAIRATPPKPDRLNGEGA